MVLSIFFSSLIFSISFLSCTNINLNLSNTYKSQWIMSDLDYLNSNAGSIPAHESFLVKVIISPDNSFICTGSCDKTVKIWDTKSHKLLATLGHSGWVKILKITKDSKFILTGCKDGSVRVWDIRSAIEDKICKFNLDKHDGKILDIKINYETDSIFVGGWDGIVNIWSLGSGELLKSIICYPDIEMDSFDLGEKYLFTAKTGDSIKIYDIKNNYYLYKTISLENNNDKVKKIYSMPGFLGIVFQSGLIRVYDKYKFTVQYDLKSNSKLVNDYPCLNVVLGFDLVNNLIIYINDTNQICIFNINTGNNKKIDLNLDSDEEIICLNLSHDSNLILLGTSKGIIRIYSFQGHEGSLNNKLLVSNLPTGSIAISRDNKYIISGSSEGKVKIYKMDLGLFLNYNKKNPKKNTIDKFSDVIITTQR